MRKKEFVGYLKTYIRDLSGYNSLSIHKLVKETKKNYRLSDSLILFCAFTNKQKLLLKYTNDPYFDVVNDIHEGNFLNPRYSQYDFQKIWDSYQKQTKKFVYEKMFKMWERIP